MTTFRNDDFFELTRSRFKQKNSFNPAQAENENITEPSYLLDKPTNLVDFVSYNNNPTKSGIEAKENIIELNKHLGKDEIKESEMTITPSITSSSFIILKVLMELGVTTINFETPCYYASLFQAEMLKLKINLIPSYLSQEFKWKLNDISEKEAVWITQPRISLSLEQDYNDLLKLLERSNKDKFYVVVDEATENNIPGIMSRLSNTRYKYLIRLRGLYKPLSVNGPRISYILHESSISELINKWIWTFHGGLDSFSIGSVPNNASEFTSYSEAIRLNKSKVQEAFNELNNHFNSEKSGIIGYENGYTTAIYTRLTADNSSKEFIENRNRLILRLDEEGIFPTLGPSMYFAHDFEHEFIRVNLLSDIEKLKKLIKVVQGE